MKRKIIIAVAIVLVLAAAVAAVLIARAPSAPVSETRPGTDPDHLYGTTTVTSASSLPDNLLVDKGNVKDIIRMADTPDTLYWEARVTLYGSQAVSPAFVSHVGRCWKYAGGRTVELVSDGAVTRRVTVTGGEATVLNSATGDSYTAPDGPQFSAEAIMGMAGIENLLDAPDGVITFAELSEYEGAQAVYAELYYPEIRQYDYYYISLEFGMPLHVQSFHAGSLVYEASCEVLTADLPPLPAE